MRSRAVAFLLVCVVLPSCSRAVPSIELTPLSLGYTASEGGISPADQFVNLEFHGFSGTSVQWNATSDQPWLTVSPASGQQGTVGETTLAVSVNSMIQAKGWMGATSTVGAPSTGSSVESGMAVWTGTRMLTWNGDPSIGGRFYDPVTDTWSGAITSVGAPPTRTYFSAVWTGSEMIIWGGITYWGGSPLNDGARYNPSTDTWTSMTTVGAPSPRWSHRAVWTGTQMIVFGGDSGGYSFKDTGGIYDPATDTWVRATSTLNAPGLRANHAAVWTGTRMLIWGGENPSKLNTGSFYDPVTDTWSGSTSTTGAPSARSHMLGVWTGREMIVWGGYDGSSMFNTGAAYNPETDTWTSSTPITGAPEARCNHAMVWTGNRMIVWGGTSPSMLLNTGGLYSPPMLSQGPYTGTITITTLGLVQHTRSITVHLTVTP